MVNIIVSGGATRCRHCRSFLLPAPASNTKCRKEEEESAGCQEAGGVRDYRETDIRMNEQTSQDTELLVTANNHTVLIKWLSWLDRMSQFKIEKNLHLFCVSDLSI